MFVIQTKTKRKLSSLIFGFPGRKYYLVAKNVFKKKTQGKYFKEWDVNQIFTKVMIKGN